MLGIGIGIGAGTGDDKVEVMKEVPGKQLQAGGCFALLALWER